MDIRVQAYSPPLPSTTRAVVPATPSRPVTAVTPATSHDRAKTLAAAAFAGTPLAQPVTQTPARGGVAFTSPPEPGQLVNILV